MAAHQANACQDFIHATSCLLTQRRGSKMKLEEFRKAGHWPTLLAAFLYFDVSFMAWVSLGPLMIYITKGMGVSVEEKLTLVAIPVLGGAGSPAPATWASCSIRFSRRGSPK